MIKETIRSLPNSPGVYLMKDAKGKIIYVGKARDLKKRVSSYFTSQELPLKTRVLVQEIGSLETILVTTETESLLLERTLIKHHKPRYNVLLKDDKEYPFFRIDWQNEWPRVRKVRKRQEDGAQYLGPFSNLKELYGLLEIAYRIFPVVRCSEYEFQQRKRPCNYFHMKQCLAPCYYPVDNELYRSVLRDVVSFLQGKSQEVKKYIEEKMQQSSDAEQYEVAAMYRDQLKSLENLKHNQMVVELNITNADFISCESNDQDMAVCVLFIRNQKVVSKEDFVLNLPLADKVDGLFSFLLQFYESRELPEELVLPFALPDIQALKELYEKPSLKSTIPQKGEKKKLLELATKNALHQLQEKKKNREQKHILLKLVQEKLNLRRFPQRIEAMDISNSLAKATVASNVCFINGKPEKSLYRIYNIHLQNDEPNDFASMYEIVSRRIRRGLEEDDLPDLLVIDGGKGQLGAALQAKEDVAPDAELDILSLAKSRLLNPGEQSQNPIHSDERIFLPQIEHPIILPLGSPEYRLFTHLRDEAHRFAITKHRKKKNKQITKSFLDEIPGVGPVLKKRILQHFITLEAVIAADVQTLMQVEGIHLTLAEKIHEALKVIPPPLQ